MPDDIVGSYVRIEFRDHFRFDKISKKKLLLNIKQYSSHSAVGDVLAVKDDFILLRNSWGENHEFIGGIAIFKPSVTRITILQRSKQSKRQQE